MRIDARIKKLAAALGEEEPKGEKLAAVRRRLEAAYLNSVLDGNPGVLTRKQGADDDNGKAQSD